MTPESQPQTRNPILIAGAGIAAFALAMATIAALVLLPSAATQSASAQNSPKGVYDNTPTPCPSTVSQILFTYPDWNYSAAAPGPTWIPNPGQGGVAILPPNGSPRALNVGGAAEGLAVNSIFDIFYGAPGTPGPSGAPFARKIRQLAQNTTGPMDLANVLYDMQGTPGGWGMNVAINPVGSEVYFSYPGWALSEQSPGPVWISDPTGKGGIGKVDFFGYVAAALPDQGNVEGIAFDSEGSLYFALPAPGPQFTRKILKLHKDGYLVDLGRVIEKMDGVVPGWSMKLALNAAGEIFFNYPSWAAGPGSQGPDWATTLPGRAGVAKISANGQITPVVVGYDRVEGLAVDKQGKLYFAGMSDPGPFMRGVWSLGTDGVLDTEGWLVKDVEGVRFGWMMDIALVECNADFPTFTPPPTPSKTPKPSKTPSLTPTPPLSPTPTPYVDPCDIQNEKVFFTRNGSTALGLGVAALDLTSNQITSLLQQAIATGLEFDQSGNLYFASNMGYPELQRLTPQGIPESLGPLWGSGAVQPGWSISLAVGPDNAVYFSRSIYADGGPGVGKFASGVITDALSGATVECMDFDAAGNLYFITHKLEADLNKLAPGGQVTTIARLWNAPNSADWWRPEIAVRSNGLVYFTMSPFAAAEAGSDKPGGVFACDPSNGAITPVLDIANAIALEFDLSDNLFIGHGPNNILDLTQLTPAGEAAALGRLYTGTLQPSDWAPDLAIYDCPGDATPLPTLPPTASRTPSPQPTETLVPTATPEPTLTVSPEPTETPSISPTKTQAPTLTASPTPGMCDPGPDAALLQGNLVEFLGAVYDPDSDTTTFTYRVTGQGAPPALSHWTLGLAACDVVSASPEPYTTGTDPTTGVTGVKWDQGLDIDETREYSVTIAGNVPVGAVDAAVKAGASFEAGHIAGPRCDCADGVPDEASSASMMMGESFVEGGDMGGDWKGGAIIIDDEGQVHTLSDAGTMPGVSVQLSGLCLSVPAAGDNIAAWWSQDGLVPLMDKTAYRIRAEVTTDQAAPGAIPFLELIYDNYQSVTGEGPTFGGTAWFLDGPGGAAGIGRPQGLGSFEVFIAPNAALTPQWRGLLGGEGAFSPQSDPINDMRLVFRALDMASGGIAAEFDSGTICVSSLRIDAFPIDGLARQGTLYDAPLSTSTHAASVFGQDPLYAQIDEMAHVATYRLRTDDDRATLIPASDVDPPNHVYNVLSLYPVQWESGALYMITARIQAAEPWGGEDPLDAIFVNADVVTSELGQMNFSSRGAEGFMLRAASPRRPSQAGGAQSYIGFFSGQNQTLSAEPYAARLRPMVDLFNSSNVNGVGSGRDAVQVLGLKVERIANP